MDNVTKNRISNYMYRYGINSDNFNQLAEVIIKKNTLFFERFY